MQINCKIVCCVLWYSTRPDIILSYNEIFKFNDDQVISRVAAKSKKQLVYYHIRPINYLVPKKHVYNKNVDIKFSAHDVFLEKPSSDRFKVERLTLFVKIVLWIHAYISSLVLTTRVWNYFHQLGTKRTIFNSLCE